MRFIAAAPWSSRSPHGHNFPMSLFFRGLSLLFRRLPQHRSAYRIALCVIRFCAPIPSVPSPSCHFGMTPRAIRPLPPPVHDFRSAGRSTPPLSFSMNRYPMVWEIPLGPLSLRQHRTSTRRIFQRRRYTPQLTTRRIRSATIGIQSADTEKRRSDGKCCPSGFQSGRACMVDGPLHQ